MNITTEFVELSKTHDGNPIGFSITTYDSQHDGPSVWLQASVHGAELQGNLVINKLMQILKDSEFIGKISFVPLANPWSRSAQFGGYTYGRFDAVRGDNWNRCYIDLTPSDEEIDKISDPKELKELLKTKLQQWYAKHAQYGLTRGKKLCYELQSKSHQYDILLDLHTASKANLYLYAPEYAKKSAYQLGFPINLIIPNTFADAGDEAHFAPWAKLYLKKPKLVAELQREAFTLELGGEDTICSKLADEQVQRILQYLHFKKVLEKPIALSFKPKYSAKLEQYKTYYGHRECLFEYNAQPGDYLNKGSIIGVFHLSQSNNQELGQETLLAHAPCVLVNHFSTANLQQGSEICQVLENPEILS